MADDFRKLQRHYALDASPNGSGGCYGCPCCRKIRNFNKFKKFARTRARTKLKRQTAHEAVAEVE